MKKVLITLIVTFAFCGSIFAQHQTHWPEFDYHDYEEHADIVAYVSIDNNLIGADNYEDIEIGAYVNNTIRGHVFMQYSQNYEYAYVHFPIYYNFKASDVFKKVSFKLYNHADECELDYCISINPDTGEDYVTGEDYLVYPGVGDVMQLSFFHTYTKPITAYSGNGGYCLIASPLNQEVAPGDVLYMISNNYDLYAFDQSAEDGLEWRNFEAGAFETLEAGKGYLYANSQDVTLTFIGAPYQGNGEVTLYRDDDAEFPGWNLVGNPFAETASIDRAFYTMNSDGSELMAGEGNEISAMEGIFVIAETDGETMTFSTGSNPGKGQIVLNVNQDRGNVIDRAIVRFGGDKLPKFMLNPSSTKLYISKDGNDYAVVNGNNNSKLPVSFKPAQDGRYTIEVKVKDETVRYLHLIDNMTGTDTDLLVTPSYSFDAKTIEDPNRFLLVFRRGISLVKEKITSNVNNGFGFFSNGNWIINNEGEAILQVVDVEGRILSSEEINGSVSKHIEAAPGVYMLRLINGKDMKVQKIVVE